MEAGVPPKIIAAIMGHTSARTTELYQHGTLEQMRKATDEVGRLLGLEG
jgi:integrase